MFQVLLFICIGLSTADHYIEPILQQGTAIGNDGQYSYNYESGIESKTEVRQPDGLTQGTYSYLDQNGIVQHVQYTAGKDGFNVISTNLPLYGAVDTPEVEAAKKQHEEAVRQALASLPARQEVKPVAHQQLLSSPVQQHHQFPVHHTVHHQILSGEGVVDTPEVAAAKAQHRAAHEAALAVLPKLAPEQHHQTISQPSLVRSSIPQHFVFPSTHSLERFTTPIPLLRHKTAEEIPRSEFGETPEVALARKEHLAAYIQAKSLVPGVTEYRPVDSRVVNVLRPEDYLLDTPEVAEAKIRHAAAVAQAQALTGRRAL